jgi:hypothetical protein
MVCLLSSESTEISKIFLLLGKNLKIYYFLDDSIANSLRTKEINNNFGVKFSRTKITREFKKAGI